MTEQHQRSRNDIVGHFCYFIAEQQSYLQNFCRTTMQFSLCRYGSVLTKKDSTDLRLLKEKCTRRKAYTHFREACIITYTEKPKKFLNV